MSTFTLKLIALVTMIIDHMGATLHMHFGFDSAMNPLRVVGRLAFPLFVFLLAEGFFHTRNAWKFAARLAAFALISEVAFDLALQGEINFLANTNIFYTLALADIAIAAIKTAAAKLPRHMWLLPYFLVLPAAIAAHLLTADYGAYGVIFIVIIYALRGNRLQLPVMALLCLYQHIGIIEMAWLGYSFPPVVWAMLPATLLPVVLVAFYNGKRGHSFKWAFYAAYPAHLAILALLMG